ncbi:MAG TPA: SNF2-related protein, partial [Longimicrobiales bacterium]
MSASGGPGQSLSAGDTSAAVRALAALYGGAPVLLDESHLLRDVLGPLMARAQSADFALARLRLGAIDLRPQELGALSRCRVLVERLEGVTGGDELAGSPLSVRRRLRLLLAFLESGRVEVRVAGGRCWTPDFSVLHGLRRADGALVDGVAALGAHYFSKPYPVSGPALTCVTSAGDTVRLLAGRFEEIWSSGYDVAFVLAERLRRLIAGDAGSSLLLRERAPAFDAAPAAVARLALEARFGRAPANGDSRPRVFDLAAFQRDAVARAELALARHGGVLLADGVGLGKTFLGLALAEAELRRGGRVLLVVPAALARDWIAPLRRLARARGARLDPQRQASARSTLVWLTHTRLSRSALPAGASAGADTFSPTLIVVDEAHAFRNPATRRYRALAELCRHARVALLTATPVNNRLSDLYFQLRLFAGDGDFAPAGVPDLRQAFDAATEEGGPGAILPVLREVVIRRTRPFLRDHYGAVALPGAAEPLRFPRRAAPRPVPYDLSRALPGGVA